MKFTSPPEGEDLSGDYESPVNQVGKGPFVSSESTTDRTVGDVWVTICRISTISLLRRLGPDLYSRGLGIGS